MKKLFITLMALSLSASAFTGNLKAVSEPVKKVQLSEKARVETMISRLNEINTMDVKSLKPTERKALRAEVYSIRQDLNAVSGGIYISFAAILIIILLLILL